MLYQSLVEFDWNAFSAQNISQAEVEECFEDPFSLRLLPDSQRFAQQSRFFALGKTLSGKALFTVYTSTGKVVRVIVARLMTEEERFFYERHARQQL